MANKKISDLDALGTTPAVGDIIPITDVSGTPTTKSVTVANLMAAAPVQTNDISDLATQVSLGSTESSLTALINLRATQVSLGNHEALTSSVHGISAFGATLVDDADASTARTTLGLGTAAAKNVGVSNGNVVELDATGLPAVDGSQLTNLPSPDVNGPLTTALRGTDNPHIGAYPNQSFKVVDNPSKSVMLGSDTDGKLYVFNSSGKSPISTGISAVEDSAEPDIEITTTTGTYSLITGDSDAKDPNGLPIQQGFNAPDIGAFSSPLLISGGSIA